MKKNAVLAPVLLLLSGCTLPPVSLPLPASGVEAQILASTSVSLSKGNYEIVKANVVGESFGVSILGLIPVKSPYYADAITQVYREAGITQGKAQALVNVVHQRSSTFYLLFSIPKITVRADVVEFRGTAADEG